MQQMHVCVGHAGYVLFHSMLSQERYFCKDAKKSANVRIEDECLFATFLGKWCDNWAGMFVVRASTWSSASTRALRASLLEKNVEVDDGCQVGCVGRTVER